jgi:hypothetical protein
MLLETQLERYRVEELARVIVTGARKTFAVLVFIGCPEAIISFIQDDPLQPDYLDRKLPLQLDKLAALLDDAVLAAQFYGKQWEFLAPVFSTTSLPRQFDKKTILPFLSMEPKGEGGFGEIFKITIEPSHHSFTQHDSHSVGF